MIKKLIRLEKSNLEREHEGYNYMINFTLKITKIHELPGVSPPGPPPGRCPGPTGSFKAPRPHDYEKKSPPLNQNPGSAPAFLEN